VSKNSTRRQVRRALAEHAETKRREAMVAAVGRARLRSLTRGRENRTAPAEGGEELILRDEDGNLRALLATAPAPAPAPADTVAGCPDGCPGDHGDDAAGNCPGCDDTCPACVEGCPGCTDTCTPPAAADGEASARRTEMAAPTDVPELPPPAERTPADQTLDPPANGVAFTIPVAVLEGYETPDSRYLVAGQGGRRDLPMTLMAMLQNPDGGWGHDAAIAVGRVDTLERFDASAVINPLTGEPYGPGVFGWKATGWLTPNEDQEGSQAAVDFIRDQVIRGVSVDLDEFTAHEEILEMDEEGWPTKWRLIVDEWSIGQMTVCPFAAFPGATIILDGETAAPAGSTEEGAVPAATVASAGQPGVLTFRGSGCAPCDAAALTASAAPTENGVAPTYPPASWFSRQPMHDQPMERHVYIGRNPDGTPTGQVYGRVAWWDACHTGVGDACVMAPRLGENGYRGFHTRGSVYTAEGEELGVGILTHGGGHANIHLGVTPALAHYDTAGAAYVKCRVGEDEDGIWFAGAFRPQITREQIEDFAAFPVSGDWRADAGDRDVRFIAAVSVNTPGFQPPRLQMAMAASGQRAITAAGVKATAARAAKGGTDAAAVEAAIARALRPVIASAARTRLRDLTRPRG
jgi:hypothetical protein